VGGYVHSLHRLRSAHVPKFYADYEVRLDSHRGMDRRVLIREMVITCALTEHHAIKEYWGSGGISPRIIDIGTRCWCGQLHALAALPSGEEPLVPIV
jgi:hypothetical protein